MRDLRIIEIAAHIVGLHALQIVGQRWRGAQVAGGGLERGLADRLHLDIEVERVARAGIAAADAALGQRVVEGRGDAHVRVGIVERPHDNRGASRQSREGGGPRLAGRRRIDNVIGLDGQDGAKEQHEGAREADQA